MDKATAATIENRTAARIAAIRAILRDYRHGRINLPADAVSDLRTELLAIL